MQTCLVSPNNEDNKDNDDDEDDDNDTAKFIITTFHSLMFIEWINYKLTCHIH